MRGSTRCRTSRVVFAVAEDQVALAADHAATRIVQRAYPRWTLGWLKGIQAESLAAYKRGAELLQYCQTALKDAQQQVQILERGVLKSFEPDIAQAPGSDEVDEP